ncbi:MAG: MFS transporter [Betaproteobacteria bacterium]|nr:MFS transporter [Betaproteobacteria bacterium]
MQVPSNISSDAWQRIPRSYAWIVFALTFGLLLSDYMSRQVLNVVFPLLKAEWNLSDTQLGSLSGVVSVAVGLLAFPLSLVADRWGRIRSLVIMAAIWSLATLICGLAEGYVSMFAARFFVGVGEAAYASVGLAVLLSIFPPQQRSSITGAFFAGSMIGSVLGIGLGGVLATHFGWRMSFVGMAAYGLALTVLYAVLVKPGRIEPAPAAAGTSPDVRPPLRSLFSTPSVISIYIGSGLQLFITGALLAWLPSYLNRFYDMPLPKAGGVAAIFVFATAAGMPLCGALADRLCRHCPSRKITLAVTYILICCSLLALAFQFAPGMPQLVLIGLAMFFGAGIMGPTGTMVANLTPPAIHSTAMATWALSNNLFGLAPGPFVTGLLADRLGLDHALQMLPLAGVAAAAVLMVGVRNYKNDLERKGSQHCLEHS